MSEPILYLETLDEHESALYSAGTDLENMLQDALKVHDSEGLPVFLRIESQTGGSWNERRVELVNAKGELQTRDLPERCLVEDDPLYQIIHRMRGGEK